MKTKCLMYCTKALPNLYKLDENEFYTDRDTHYNGLALNGKIVAECEIEIEEHKEPTIDWLCMSLREKIVFGNLCEKASIDELECYKYANGKPLYALHIKNLHIFDNPRELSDFNKIIGTTYGEEPDETITRAPQNMMRCCYEKKPKKWETGVLISIQPQWLCKILNGEKTIEVRRKVLNCMKEVIEND